MIEVKNSYVKKYDTLSLTEEIKLKQIKEIIEEKQEMLDWIDIETTISDEEIKKIQELVSSIREKCDIFLVIGIGGSYLGSKAVIEALSPYFNHQHPEIIFLGHNLSTQYLEEVIDYIKNKNVYVNVISKSGNTLETTIAFNRIYEYLKENDYNYQEKIIVTTDANKGNLRALVNKENFISLEVPKNIGGRFSVLTAVGLFPIAVAGIDIKEILAGASNIRDCYNLASKVALIRYHLEQAGKKIEAVTFYEEKLSTFAAWYQQLFAETQGKNGKGILPFPNPNTTNLHSLGQYFQEGTKQVFETIIKIEDPTDNKTLNSLVLEQVAIAHLEGDTPSLILSISKLDPYHLGKLIYLLEMSATIGAYLLEVNPFDQPGVEKYKQNVHSQLENSI